MEKRSNYQYGSLLPLGYTRRVEPKHYNEEELDVNPNFEYAEDEEKEEINDSYAEQDI